jgi:phospholipid transport system substrate-binding protein
VKRRMVHFFAALLSMLAFTVAGSALASPATDMVKTKQTVLFDLLKQANPDNQKKLDAVFDEMIDYQALAEASLGAEWAPRSDAEKAQFTGLLKQLVRNAYQKNLKKIVNFNVNYVGEEPAGDAVLVKTTSTPKDPREDPVEINFKMLSANGKGWKVQDIVTEGASMVQGFRRDFLKVITKDGFPALIQKMKDKLAKGDS